MKKRHKIEIGKEGVEGWVAETRKALRVDDVRREPWMKWYVASVPDTRSELSVPLLLDEELIGIFDLQSPRVGEFDEDDERLITSLAGQVVVALRNAEQYQALVSIYDVGKMIAASSSTEQILQLILNEGMEKTGAHSASARQLDRTERHLRLLVRRGKETEKSRIPIRVGKGIVGTAAKEKRTISVADVNKDHRYLMFFPGTKSEVAVPMVDPQDKLVAVLNFEHSRLDAFEPEDIRFIQSLASIGAVAIERVEKNQELRKAKEQLDAVNAIFWLTMIRGSWLHAVNQKTHAIRVAVDLIKSNPSITRENLVETLDTVDELACMITKAAPEFPSEDTEGAVSMEVILDSVVRESWHERKDIEVDFEMPSGPLPFVMASSAWLALAFKNVIRNSLTAMPSGGTLNITCKKSSRGIDVIIKDTGCGVQKAIQKRLFAEPTSGTRGSGMGLLITKNVMLKYGGNIELEDTGPQGTTFRLWLPV